MSRSPLKKSKLARKQTDRTNGMRRKRDGDDRGDNGEDNGGGNRDNKVELKDNSRKED